MQIILRGLIRIRRCVAGIFSGRTPYVDKVQGGGIFLDKAKGLYGVAAWGVPGAEPPGRRKIFKKIPMKNYSFRAIFQNFNENFAIFTKKF